MALDREVEAIALKRRGMGDKARTLLNLTRDVRTARAYRRLFLHNGQLTPDGELVLADLARAAGLGKVRPGGSAEEMNFREGRRALFLHITAKLDARNIEQLARRMREAHNDGSDAE